MRISSHLSSHVVALAAFIAASLVGTSLVSSCSCGGPTHGEGEGEQGEGEGEGEGATASCTIDADCNDNDACTTDHCAAGVCTHGQALDGTPCGDNPCTDDKACVLGFCTAGHAPNFDVDGDGFLTKVCGGNDCDDNDAAVHPGAAEGPPGDATCSDGKDNDCDGAADALDVKCGATELCVEGWCFENPRPHGFPLQAVWPSSDTDVWLGSQLGGFAHYDGAAFTIAQASVNGFAANVARMWGSSPTDIWAAAGALLHYDGTQWTQDNASAGLGAFLDVWGFAANDVWAVGSNVAAHFDGTAWTAFDLHTTETFTALHGLATNDLWAVGSGPLAAHWDGTQWTTAPVQAGSTTLFFTSVWESAPGEVWAGGDFSQMWHLTNGPNGTWAPVASVQNHRVAALAGSAADDVWGVGDGGIVQHWNGTSWGQAATFPVQSLFGVRMISATDIWAVGSGGAIIHYDGTQWTRAGAPQSPLDARLTAVAVAPLAGGGFDAWAAGADNVTAKGAIGKRGADGVWQLEPGVPDAAAFSAMTAAADDDVWALGSQTAVHWDGSQWASVDMPVGGTAQIADACNNGATELWAITSKDFSASSITVLQGDGTNWSVNNAIPVSSSSDAPAPAHVFCTGPNDVWLGGIENVLHRDPTTGAFVRTGTAPLASFVKPAVAAASPSDVWFVDAAQSNAPVHALLHYDGVDVSDVTVSADLPGSITDVADAAGDVWLCGSQGLLAHDVNGAFVAADLGGATDNFAFVRPLANGHVMLVTSDLVTFEYDGTQLLSRQAQATSIFQLGDVSFASADDGWAIDTEVREAFHWDGSTWTSDSGFGSFQPATVFAFAPNNVFIGGDENASLAHFDGTQWTTTQLTEQSGSFPDNVLSVWGAAPNDVWATVRNFGSVTSLFHKTAGAFVAVPLPSGINDDQEITLAAVHGSSPTDLWFVGNEGVFSQRAFIVRGDGTTFARFQTLDDPIALGVVDGTTYAIDAFGGAWKRTSAGWTVLTAPTYDNQDPVDTFNPPLTTAIIAKSGNLVGFAMGPGGGIVAFDGTHLGAPSSAANVQASAFGAAGGDVFAVGGGANVLHHSH